MHIPLTVPKSKKQEYLKNLKTATLNTGNLFIFAGDQKIEHLNDDFYGKGISKEDASPKHLFEVAKNSKGVVLATQLGLLSQYGSDYPKLPYILKINSKTNLYDNKDEAISKAFYHLDQVIEFKKQSKLNIVGIGYTIYLGSKYESQMLTEAAQVIYQAHQNGLLTIIWAYTRNKQIKNANDPHLIAGAAGVAACLGADFAKVNYPYDLKNKKQAATKFQEAILAAGKTKLICVGGSLMDSESYLEHLYNQFNVSKTNGVALGRNIHQRSLKEATQLTKAISSIIHYNYSLKDAKLVLKNKKDLPKRRRSLSLKFF